MLRSVSRSDVALRLFALFNRLLLQEAEDVVEDEVAIRLFSQEESLDKLLPCFTLVRHLTNDLNDDSTVCGGLSINRVDEDLAVLESNRGNLTMNFL